LRNDAAQCLCLLDFRPACLVGGILQALVWMGRCSDDTITIARGDAKQLDVNRNAVQSDTSLGKKIMMNRE